MFWLTDPFNNYYYFSAPFCSASGMAPGSSMWLLQTCTSPCLSNAGEQAGRGQGEGGWKRMVVKVDLKEGRRVC